MIKESINRIFATRLFARINLSLAITIFIALVWSSVDLVAVQQEPEVEYVQSFWRLSPDKTNLTVVTRMFYPTDFEVEVNIVSKPSWLQVGVKHIGDINEYCFSIDVNDICKIDLEATFNLNQLAKRDENGNVGDFTEGANSETMPKDRYETITCQWDPGADLSYPISETNKYAFISASLPEQNSGEFYTLFGRGSTNLKVDVDYYLLRPTSSAYDIWIRTRASTTSIKLSVVQNNEVKATVNAINSSAFYKALTCTNLNSNADAFAVIESQSTNSVENIDYKIAYYDRQDIIEQEKWDDSSADASLESRNFQVYTFLALSDKMAVEFYANENEANNWDNIKRDILNDSFHSITQYCAESISGKTGEKSFPKSDKENKFERYVFDDLQISNTYYCVVKSENQQLIEEDKIKLRISRFKPVFLVHGIDAGPKFPDDKSTFFGGLTNATQYFNFRPYACYDFMWDSDKEEGILKEYIGYGAGKLGNFFKENIKSNDLKATVVAHSMGCVLTYYQCQNSPSKFKKYVNNIMFAAPPFFGSYAANEALETHLLYKLKKTSKPNFELLSRGSRSVWERHNNPLSFKDDKITVAIGTNKYIKPKDAWNATFDSLDKISFWDIFMLHKLKTRDALTDLIYDGLEGIGELGAGVTRRYFDHRTKSELYYKNISDSAVGTYSANLKGQNNYSKVTTYYVNKLHSETQLFEEGNSEFVNAVREKINDIGD